jgi:hypothetical protein
MNDRPPLESCQEWHLYNPQTQERLGPMPTDQLKKYLIKFDPISQSAALVWCPFWKGPQRGDDVLQMLGNLPAGGADPTRTIRVIYENSQPFIARLYPIDRKFPRLPGNIDVTLISKTRRVRTRACSLSMGGMGFSEGVPRELFAPTCKAVLYNPVAAQAIVACLKNVLARDAQAPVTCVRFEELRGFALPTYIEWLQPPK